MTFIVQLDRTSNSKDKSNSVRAFVVFSESWNCVISSERAAALTHSLTIQGAGLSASIECLLGKSQSSGEGRKTRQTITQKVPAFPHCKALESSPQRSRTKGPGDWPFLWDLRSSAEMSQYWRWLAEGKGGASGQGSRNRNSSWTVQSWLNKFWDEFLASLS